MPVMRRIIDSVTFESSMRPCNGATRLAAHAQPSLRLPEIERPARGGPFLMQRWNGLSS